MRKTIFYLAVPIRSLTFIWYCFFVGGMFLKIVDKYNLYKNKYSKYIVLMKVGIFYLLGICFVKGKSLQKVIYKNICMCYSRYIKK